MVSLNEKGIVQHKVTLQKRGEGAVSHILLKNVLINKSENYHLQVDRFLTNEIPQLLQNTRVLAKIRPRYEQGQPTQDDNTNQIDGYHTPHANFHLSHAELLKAYQFQPTVFSLAGLCSEFGKYIRRFNFLLNIVGADHTNAQNGAVLGINIPNVLLGGNTGQFDLGTYVDSNQLADYIKIGFEPDGSIVFHFSREFLANFYIELDEVFAKIIGFPPVLYAYYNGAAVFMSNQNVPDLVFNGIFNLPMVVPALGTQFETIISTGSIFKFDERISIDIEIALPLSRTIDVFGKTEKHTFILSRFMLTDYKHLNVTTQQRQGVILSKSLLQDELSSGAVDLVRGFPQTHTAQLLNGKIQAMDLRLVLRYKTFYINQAGNLNYTIESKTMKFQKHSFFDILLHFIKKL
jgi:hypothetical protein